MIALIVGAGGVVCVRQWVMVSDSEGEALLSKACADADTLRRAHLLDESIAQYGAISDVDPARICAGGAGAGKREQSAQAWRAEVLRDLRISGELVERARLYRRAYLLKRGPSVLEGRRRARQRLSPECDDPCDPCA